METQSNTVTEGIGDTNLGPLVTMGAAKMKKGKLIGLSVYSRTAAADGGILWNIHHSW